MMNLEELAEKYGNDQQKMLDHMMNTVRTYGHNIKPEEYFSVIESWVVSLLTYQLRVVLAGSEPDAVERSVGEFMDYAMFDKMARLYDLLASKKGKSLIVP